MLLSVFADALLIAATALVVSTALTVLILSARCKECGVSTFWHEKSLSNTLVGIDLIKSPSIVCEKCGAPR